MKMFETIGVLMVFFVILALGMVFYHQQQTRSAKNSATEARSLDAIAVAQTVSFLPEMQCTFENIGIDGCIDILKMEAFQTLLDQTDEKAKQYYFGYLGYSKITVTQLYPDAIPSEAAYEKVVYYYPRGSEKEKRTTHVPISLFDPVDQSYKFGVLTVEVYTK